MFVPVIGRLETLKIEHRFAPAPAQADNLNPPIVQPALHQFGHRDHPHRLGLRNRQRLEGDMFFKDTRISAHVSVEQFFRENYADSSPASSVAIAALGPGIILGSLV